MTPMPKHKRWRSEKYLKFIRKQPCIICQYPSEPHHIKIKGNSGMARKPDDTYCIPLCRLHHSEIECPELKHLAPFFERHGIDMYKELFLTTKKYIEQS